MNILPPFFPRRFAPFLPSRRRCAAVAPLILFLLLADGRPALAHAVFIFGWEEGGQVCTESYFSKKRKVIDGLAQILTPEGDTLAEGRTDADGRWCVPAPSEQTRVRLVINAGEGHRGEFELALRPAPPAAAPPPAIVPPAIPAPPTALSPKPGPAAEAAFPAEELRALIRESVRAELVPLQKSLAELQAEQRKEGPSLTDIIGGVGWLFGLCGIAALLMRRRGPKE